MSLEAAPPVCVQHQQVVKPAPGRVPAAPVASKDEDVLWVGGADVHGMGGAAQQLAVTPAVMAGGGGEALDASSVIEPGIFACERHHRAAGGLDRQQGALKGFAFIRSCASVCGNGRESQYRCVSALC